MDKSQYITGKNAFQNYASADVNGDNFIVAKAFNGSRTFQNFEPNISVRSEYGRRDYDYFRINESVPNKPEDLITLCLELYKRNGIVKNVVDLMADFASRGIKLQHPNPAVNRYYQAWSATVGLSERSERIVNILLKAGNVVLKKSYAKIGAKIEGKWKKGKAQDLELETKKVNRREVPIRYTTLLPTSVEVVGGELSNFAGKPIYVIKLPMMFRNTLNDVSKTFPDQAQELINRIPADIRDRILSNQRFIPVDQSKIEVLHYKKDDWELWGDPLIRPVVSDLLQLEKYKLADLSALDGAISNIRLWNLGIIGDSPSNSILPTKAAMNKLRNILANNIGGGVLDLVWGPELKFTESNSQVWRWLGASKYEPVWAAIYDGLGLPPSLRSAGKGASGTGNFVGLSTLVKRLEYVRDILVAFWKREVAAIHEAMGFPGQPPDIIFDIMVFADEAAEKQLWINLWDRNIVPTETIQEIMGRNPEFENARLKREYKAQENGTMPDKAGPYSNPDKDQELKKIALQNGVVTPSEVGLQLEEKKDGEKNGLEMQAKLTPKVPPGTKKPAGIAGRPKNVVETKKRKPKPKGKPSTKAALFTWSLSSYQLISDIITPIILNSLNKSNARKLSNEEAQAIELIKFEILCNMKPFEQFSEDKVYSVLNSSSKKYIEFIDVFNRAKNSFIKNNKKEPTLDELRTLYASSYALYFTE